MAWIVQENPAIIEKIMPNISAPFIADPTKKPTKAEISIMTMETIVLTIMCTTINTDLSNSSPLDNQHYTTQM